MSVSTPTRDQRVERHLMRVRGAGKTARHLKNDLFTFSICTTSSEKTASLPPAKKRKVQHKVTASHVEVTASVPQHVQKVLSKTEEQPDASVSAKARARARAAKLFAGDDEPRTVKVRAKMRPHPERQAIVSEQTNEERRRADDLRQALSFDATRGASRSETRKTSKEHTIHDMQSAEAACTVSAAANKGPLTCVRQPLASMSPNRVTGTKTVGPYPAVTKVPTKTVDGAGDAADTMSTTKSGRPRRTATKQDYRIMLQPMPTPRPRKRRLPLADDH